MIMVQTRDSKLLKFSIHEPFLSQRPGYSDILLESSTKGFPRYLHGLGSIQICHL